MIKTTVHELIKITNIETGFQPRKNFTGIKELAENIKENGLIQPITVRRLSNGKYKVVAGERRLRACHLAGMDEIEAIIKDIDDTAAFKIAVVENMQREDLTPFEEALSFQELQNRGMKQKEIGALIGYTQSKVATQLRMLSLPEIVVKAWDKKEISEGHAKQLLKLPSADDRELFYKEIMARDITVKALKKEIDFRLEQLKMKNSISSGSLNSEDAIISMGIDNPFSDCWNPGIFRRCESHMCGVAALLFYYVEKAFWEDWFGLKISVVNFPAEKQGDIERAINISSQWEREEPHKANLILVNNSDEGDFKNVKKVFDNANENQIIFVYAGSDTVGYDQGNMFDSRLCDYDWPRIKKNIVVPIKDPGEDLTEQEIETLKRHPQYKKNFINSYRVLEPFSMSRDILLKWSLLFEE